MLKDYSILPSLPTPVPSAVASLPVGASSSPTPASISLPLALVTLAKSTTAYNCKSKCHGVAQV
ncbi:hypothetical protein RhiirA1_482086 [Rhizophagus irregularis]|uniref:Uncharacterized protein n=1 Tax=Rhizophagus irregularis TaxID=588596 RepID=A0A2I1FL21_9GLOM|nr:hypothetical protein RhiirA1_482086 [Rhizophagus irregularis]PKY35053.1 hypothetical protein RhiirB3_455383 [Rhizophagus irregularis]